MCGQVLLSMRGFGSGDASYLWEVKYLGLVVSVFWGMGGDLRVHFGVMCGCIWLS